MKALRRPTRLVPAHNPTGELVNILYRRTKAVMLKRWRRRTR